MNEKIKEFINRWQNKGREKQDTQTFWIELLTDVLGVEDATKRIDFEKTVKIKGDDGREHTKFIDGYIPETKVLIEQKDAKLSLNKAYSMSGTDRKYTPYEQGDRYGRHLNQKEVPRYIIACNFKEIEVHDNNHRGEAPQVIKLENLEQDYTRLSFLVDSKNKHLEEEKKLSVKAGQIVGKIYDAILERYKDPGNPLSLESLNIFIVRLVFLLYAEDSGILKKAAFLNYMEQFRKNPGAFRRELLILFEVLDTPFDERDPYMSEDLAEFPYVNGGLFNKNIKVVLPNLNENVINLILDEASAGFNWQGISPTIFGATFESTLNPETRRSGGMHYTSLENIHKVIDPLFLDDLKSDLKRIEENSNAGSKVNALRRFIDRLASLNFLDPACGSGNFLTETYLELRRLENKALSIINKGQIMFGDVLENPIKVSLDQFFGIEINDFAVAVANTALFISEYQMLKETEAILNRNIDYLPLHSFDGIHEGNSLQIDWNDILPASKCNYIMGNPPYAGGMLMNTDQKKDLRRVMKGFKNVGEMDYIAAWFKKAAVYMNGTKIKTAFVSTNSIVQGQQAVTLWKPLIEKYKVNILFAYQSFVWNSQSQGMAHVHCVIIGFSDNHKKEQKKLFTNTGVQIVDNISIYLKDMPNIYIESRSTPLCFVPAMHFGNMPRDGGFFSLNEDEKNNLIKKNPLSKKWIRPYIGAREFLNNKKRWCLWLIDAEPGEIRKCPEVVDRINKVRKFRENSKAKATQKFSKTPTRFVQIAQPDVDYIAVPSVSSERRRYVPIGFLNKNTIASNLMQLIPGANLFHFGILTSNVHNAWMREVAGRLEMRYRYSKDIVYNNFPWPNPSQDQKQRIEETAKSILKIREKYPNSSLADLYDPLTMPQDLLQAHRENDRAVMEAYGWNWREMSEEDCVAELMKLYQEKVDN